MAQIFKSGAYCSHSLTLIGGLLLDLDRVYGPRDKVTKPKWYKNHRSIVGTE